LCKVGQKVRLIDESPALEPPSLLADNLRVAEKLGSAAHHRRRRRRQKRRRRRSGVITLLQHHETLRVDLGLARLGVLAKWRHIRVGLGTLVRVMADSLGNTRRTHGPNGLGPVTRSPAKHAPEEAFSLRVEAIIHPTRRRGRRRGKASTPVKTTLLGRATAVHLTVLHERSAPD